MSYDTAIVVRMEAEFTGSDAVRIPAPREGVATHVRRYSEDRAVIVHPSDFERFAVLDGLLAAVSAAKGFAMSDAAREAHIESVTPGTPVTDPDELRRLFA